MSQLSASQFLDGIRSSQLLDEPSIAELQARPEALWSDVDSLAKYAQDRGWLTPYQSTELIAGRGDRLNIAGYRIFDKIEEGAFGTHYKALHPALRQPVSIRLLRGEWLSPADSISAYVTRTQAASLAQSPHLANLLDGGTLDSGPFVVHEFVDGCDLFRMVNEMGALPLGLACEYIRQAALAVQAAHEKGVAHGDVTPHNLLLTPVKRVAGTNGDVSIRPWPGASVKLAEFGLAPKRPAIGELTFGESDRLGTLGFLPPERMTDGERTQPGDLYGLGGSLYFLLTTRPPHSGDSNLEVMLDIQQGQPAPLESIKSGVPSKVAQLVGRLLDSNPYSRPSASDVVTTLLPYCERLAAPVPQDILLAHEAFTPDDVPNAVPVARNLDQPTHEDDDPFAEEIPQSSDMPLVEPMSSTSLAKHAGLLPEIHPLDEHHAHDDGHLDTFEHSAMGANAPLATRPKAKATGKNMVWIVAGLCLHVSAVILLIGYMTNWFASSSTPTPPEHKEEKKATTKYKGKTKRD
ncbi:MAG: serine/threonine protein kinase [Gemmataceae bacterium]|nr:serine/threonine protein kinase [Gemmataceae bacterium]